MNRASFAVALVGAVLLIQGCEQVKSANPLSPSIAGPIPGVNITAPLILEPPMGAEVKQEGQPISLLIENASTNGERPLWLRIELASDAGFTQVLHQADRVSPGEGGRTSYRMPQLLGTGHTYYWRAQAMDGANTGPFSSVASFRVVHPVVLDPPTPLEPIGQLTHSSPTFKVRNGRIEGTTDVIYRIEVATSPDPSTIVAVLSASPDASGTTTVSVGDVPAGTTFYWRTYATDGTTQSAYSEAVSFRTADPAAPAPGPGPAPGPAPSPSPPPSGGNVGPPRNISEQEALQIIRSVHDQERWDLGSRSSREQRVQFLHRAVAAIHFGHPRYNSRGPDANWCVKDAGGGRPPSDDVLVRCNSRDAWDLIGGAGADGYSFHMDYIGRLAGGQNVYPPPRSALPQ
jgi:hypothetical protein